MVAYLVERPAGTSLSEALSRGDELHVPALCDIEFASALRHAARARPPEVVRLDERLATYLALPLHRHPHEPLLRRVLELREALSAYDAAYVALAELLDAALLTDDKRLARAIRAERLPVRLA